MGVVIVCLSVLLFVERLQKVAALTPGCKMKVAVL